VPAGNKRLDWRPEPSWLGPRLVAARRSERKASVAAGCRAAIVVSGGICEDLQNLIPVGSGFVLENATGINNKGQIVVNAYTTSTYAHHALLLTPK
jgi:hypothetical protein